MADLVQWAKSNGNRPSFEEDVSPRTVTPKSSFNRKTGRPSPTRSTPSLAKHSPTRKEVFNEDYERRPSPLRTEFRATGEEDRASDPEGPTPISAAASSAGSINSFRLQDAPKGRKKPSGYFALQKTLPETAEVHGETDDTPAELTRRLTNNSGTQTPPGRRSVQFARQPDLDGTLEPQVKSPITPNGKPDELDENGRREVSLFARLKALASPTASTTHGRHPSGGAESSLGTPFMTPASEREEPRFPTNLQYGSEAEADVDESSGGEEAGRARSRSKPRKRRKKAWLDPGGSATAPATPRNGRFPSFLREASNTPSEGEQRPGAFVRRSTMNDIPEDATRAGYSEDEGRDRIAKRWKRGIEGARGLSYSNAVRRRERSESPEERRPTAFRRLTAFTAFDGNSSPFRSRAERPGSLSAQKWRQVKAGLKLLGQKKKDARVRVDFQKSAELMAELLAGAPAALFLASMYQRDEHGKKKIPALLEQLKVSIPSSSTREDKSGDRHLVFTINLEYGNGPSRMAWTIHRSLRDFANLHLKYKLQSQTERYIQLKGEDRHRAKIPRFPRSAFPYLRGFRGLGDEDFEDEDPTGEQGGATEGEQSGAEPQSAKKRRQSSTIGRKPSFHRRKPSSLALGEGANQEGGEAANSENKGPYPDRQRKKLEIYLQQMIRWLIFRPDSTRLCKFLELSALSMRLSVEGGYHGKEGLLTITSKRAVERQGLRAFKALPDRLKTMPDRHKPKWFMVRDSYIAAVDSPESLVPTEVFLVDCDFSTDGRKKRLRDQSAQEIAKTAKASAGPQHHLLKIYNSERKLRLLARNERQLMQFKESIDFMKEKTLWAQKQRFDSFAPVRKNVFARWLVDGRDHMWQVSRAIDNARNFVYIHDWWLSPELYLRRPPAISQRWRLDRLLLEKAQQGVKIFIIVYRNIESAIPIDSDHTKTHLLELHPNICVQRSPNQFRQNQFFWAHHEKLVVVDNAMAFVGGVDLCFGRWDDPHHVLTDDKLTGFESDFPGPRNSHTCQSWPGKDYSNPRVQDFYALDQPYEEMYDRTRIPRMPWHDIAMCIVGQPARDVARHFVQRWNYILRQRTPSRPTPVLLPPPEFEQEELDKMGMTGTCQIQILRSCTAWSIGTPNKTECSIMNAYEHLIRNSDHFIYIENQFFISSCTVEGTRIHNKIGDALVDRIEQAFERGENWRACLLIPLMPGFQSSVDSQDGTSVRLIMQCQYRSICRGETSIFGRLKAKGIDPSQYIEFYALRQWGKIGPNQSLTTEQLYIHAKCMIVDDRAAIIGSANINERSMLGSRDSEVASLVIDQETMPSYMGGKPYNVGVFPHTLRMRLMREHLGIDVDEFYQQNEENGSDSSSLMDPLHAPRESFTTPPASPRALTEQNLAADQNKQQPHNPEDARMSADSLRAWITKTGNDASSHGQASEPDANKARTFGEKLDLDVAGYGIDNARRLSDVGVAAGRESFVNTHGHEVLAAPVDAYEPRRNSSVGRSHGQMVADTHTSPTPPWSFPRQSTQQLGLTQLSQLPALPVIDDTDIGGPPVTRNMSTSSAHVIKPLLSSLRRPIVEDNCMQDPLVDSFYKEIWHKVAENNTKLYRQVFRCMPDSEVQSWKEYREYNVYNEKFMQSQGLGNSKPKPPHGPHASGPPGSAGGTESVTSEKAAEKADTTKNRLSGFASKLLRPTSNASELAKRQSMPEMMEKDKHGAGAADPSQQQVMDQIDGNGELNEKVDGLTLQDTTTTTTEKSNGLAPNDTNQLPVPNGSVQDKIGSPDPEKANGTANGTVNRNSSTLQGRRSRTITFSAQNQHDPHDTSETTATQTAPTKEAEAKRRRRATTRSSGRPMITPEEVLDKEEAEELLKLVQGHLVLWPYEWLEKEERGGNWLYNIDQIAPLEIYD
ncbi:phospholipase-like protein 2 [Elsinoe australis]|uniref:Phospholipase D1 n=1 Tax=Elsinoe australis TaxID=40998 RepID=A0A4U7B0K0_9PEZI|nr:phospholipase-like protein 2 [Elsinoe australis]